MLKLYNTLSRKNEDFKPLKGKQVGLYTCGPTVYNYAHIGNLRTYVFEDVLKRVLGYNKYKVNHVMNITDVGHLTSDADEGEDKLEKGAEREKKTVWEVAEFYTKAFKDDMKELNLLEPDTWCEATDHIKEMIAMVKKIEDNGYAYKTSDGIYFDTDKLKDYGKLAKLDIEGLREGARVEENKEKKNPTDFALWKFSPADKKRQMEWDSPWGKGFPGWHIECSAMSMKYLGETFDMHCGGIDHVPIHHTNEIAQAEAATGKEFVKYWLHGEFLNIKEGKMAKSAGNFITLKTLTDKKLSPLAYRYLLLTAHYRAKLDFSWESLEGAQTALNRLCEAVGSYRGLFGKVNKDYQAKFEKAINDDLDMPRVMALVWELVKDGRVSDKDKKATLKEFDKVLGLGLAKVKKTKLEVPAEVQELVKQREEARKNKHWPKSDEIRDKIKELGFEVEDTPQGPKLKKIK